MALTKEDLQAIEQIFDRKMDEKLEPIKEDLEEIKEDVSTLKEESTITRHSVNLLLKWAEHTDRTVNVGLYDE